MNQNPVDQNNNLSERVDTLGKKVARLKERVTTEKGRLAGLVQQREQYIEQLESMGINPNELDNIIQEKEQTLTKLTVQAEISLKSIEEARERVGANSGTT